MLVDRHGRHVSDLRVSLTDRCNFRCLYCLPETEAAANFYQSRFQPDGRTFSTEPIQRKWQPRSKILTYEEIERVVAIFAGLGVNSVLQTTSSVQIPPTLAPGAYFVGTMVSEPSNNEPSMSNNWIPDTNTITVLACGADLAHGPGHAVAEQRLLQLP